MVLDKVSSWISMVGEWLVPILATLGAIAAAGIWIADIFKKRKEMKKDDLMIDSLKSLAEKADSSTAITKLSGIFDEYKDKIINVMAELKNVQTQMIDMGQIMSTIFENSSLPTETKDRLRALSDKLEYNIDTDYLDNIVAEHNRTLEELEITKKQLEEVTTPTVTEVVSESADAVNYSSVVQ